MGLHLLFLPNVQGRLVPRESMLHYTRCFQFFNALSFQISVILHSMCIASLFMMPESLLVLEESFKKLKGKNCHHCHFFNIALQVLAITNR